MTDPMEVLLEDTCSAADLAAVTRVFEDAGIPADIARGVVRRSAGLLPWVILIGGGYASWTFVKAAIQGAGDEAGREGWRALMRLVKGLYEARSGSQLADGTVSVRAEQPAVEIVFSEDLPEGAYEQLWEIESPRAPLSGVLMWDNEAQAWRDSRARWARCDYPGCQEPATQARTRQVAKSSVERREFCDGHAAEADVGDPRAWA